MASVHSNPLRSARWAVTSALLLTSCFALAFEARVIGVHDGDTLTVLVDQRPLKVRLAEIDAPELGQPFGHASTESLKALCASQDAEVTPVAKDRYGRTVGRVTCRQTDASTHQVRNGMAWVYDRFSTPSSPLYATQALAREAGRGLWADRNPVAPWVWRKPQ